MKCYIVSTGIDPVEDRFNVGFFDAKLIAISDRTLQENFDRDWKLGNPLVFELGKVKIFIVFVADSDWG